MAKVSIDVVDYEYTEEVIRNRHPEVHIDSVQDSKFWTTELNLSGPYEAVKKFMVEEYCEGMHPEDAKFYVNLIKK
ncbi:hypothetical protein JS09_038 [Escherichia phage vB_EcoM_JS09]|jgi:hypothetical protein|uniref:Uncharacterized 8.8 kDa protein in frd-Gp32 intergenic region n=1 Tax=Escherichia phage vB_EcoM_JS09 TaxID=1430444 RepID=A0A060BHN2_9CAUD|nr:hypothetical protein JS09_038 [Escherichia phage vB_EcoM_JS09]AIA80005.1 hypothetical protein JS09_038 [Escherichia phage vB_EcoM_JS09]